LNLGCGSGRNYTGIGDSNAPIVIGYLCTLYKYVIGVRENGVLSFSGERIDRHALLRPQNGLANREKLFGLLRLNTRDKRWAGKRT